MHTSAELQDPADLVRMMAAGISETLLDDGADFADHLARTLDVHSSEQVRFGMTRGLQTARLAEAVLDPAAYNVVYHGNLAVVGAMALIHGFEAPQKLDARKARSVEAAGAIGLEQLLRIRQESYGVDDRTTGFVDALLRQPPADPEALAIELLDLHHETSEYLIAWPNDTPVLSVEKAPGQELYGPAQAMAIAEIELRLDAIARMDWLDLSGRQTLPAHTIHAGAKPVAYVADLTGLHHQLGGVMQELHGHKRVYPKFCNRLAFSILNYLANPGSVRRLSTQFQKLPTYVADNGSQANEELFRAYYAPIGTHRDGLPVFGLMAGFRTKDRQAKVLGVISNRRPRDIGRRLYG